MKELRKAVAEGNLILFVGAGVSQCLGLPTFNEMMADLARQFDIDIEILNVFGDNKQIAEYLEDRCGGIGRIRSELDRLWHGERDISAYPIFEAIVGLNCRTIYTTNYDKWLEKAHQYYQVPHKVIVSLGDVVQATNGDVQIIKYHGDFTDDESIVLTESTYMKRLDFENPLDIKLRSDVLGKSVLFIGYSMEDINIRYLIYRLNQQWEDERLKDVRPKSYIYLYKPNPVQERIFQNWNLETIRAEPGAGDDGLVKMLNGLVCKDRRAG